MPQPLPSLPPIEPAAWPTVPEVLRRRPGLLVHDWLTGMRGGEKCLEVAAELFPQAPLYTLLHKRGSVSPRIENRPIRTSLLQRLPWIDRWYRLLLPLMPTCVERLRPVDPAGWALSFSHAVCKGLPLPAGTPHVCVCFTPMRYAWDLRDEYLGPGRGLWGGLQRKAFDKMLDRLRDWDRRSAAGVTHFVAISREIAGRIERSYGRTSEIIYPPVDVEFYCPAPRPTPREDFYLCVSALVPYKRIDLAAAACRKLGRRLIVIGDGPERARWSRAAGDGIRFLGRRDDAEIRDHYRRCRALLFPGHEDFGIVPVEAQACGAPVIALGRGGALETVRPAGDAGPGTGLFHEAPDVDSLIDAIERFEADPAACDPHAARRWAETFAVPRFASQLLDCLARAVREGSRHTVPEI